MLTLPTLRAFADELQKIAASKKPGQSLPAKESNELFGRPMVPDPKAQKRIDQGSAAAASPSRDASPIDGQSTANVAGSNQVSPASGPGGV
jgi:hypothetical protein